MSINFHTGKSGHVTRVTFTDDELLRLRGLSFTADAIVDRVVKEELRSPIYVSELAQDLYWVLDGEAEHVEIPGRDTISGNPVLVSLEVAA